MTRVLRIEPNNGDFIIKILQDGRVLSEDRVDALSMGFQSPEMFWVKAYRGSDYHPMGRDKKAQCRVYRKYEKSRRFVFSSP